MNKTANKYQIYLIYILLAVITFIAFEPILYNSFISFDDNVYIYENGHITSGLTLENIIWAFTNIHANNYHPVTSLSHMLDCELYGLYPIGHHFTSLLFHIANTLLLFMVLSRMTKRVWASAFVAALFAIHPLHVESVAWASERKDVLSAFFWLLTMLAYARYCCCAAVPAAAKRTPGLDEIAEATSHGVNSGPGAKHYYLLTIVFFILGLLSKPMVVTLPAVLLLLDYWPMERFGKVRTGKLILEKIPFFVLSAVFSFITMVVQGEMGVVKTISNYPLQWRIENALVSYVIYIIKMIWPVNLAIFYPHPKGNIPSWQAAAAIVILTVITCFAILKIRKRPYIAVGWLWFLGTLVPVIGLCQVGMQGHADRYTYIPYIGLFITIAWGVSDLLTNLKYKKLIYSVCAGLLLFALGVKTYVQTLYWQNNILLYSHAVNAVKNNWWAHGFLGTALASLGEYEGAIVQFNKSMEIYPDNASVYYELANAYFDTGDMKQAAKMYQKLLPPLPEDLNEPRGVNTSRYDYPLLRNLYVSANTNLATALAGEGNYTEAARRFKEALRVAPNAEAARRGLEKLEKETKEKSLLP